MSDYTTKTWASGGTVSSTTMNDFDDRVDTAFGLHETTMDGHETTLGLFATRLDDLEGLMPRVPSANGGTVVDLPYTLGTADVGCQVKANTAGTVVIPAFGSSVTAGAVIEVLYTAATGALVISGTAGVTLHVEDNAASQVSTQYGVARLRKDATNTWYLNGAVG